MQGNFYFFVDVGDVPNVAAVEIAKISEQATDTKGAEIKTDFFQSFDAFYLI